MQKTAIQIKTDIPIETLIFAVRKKESAEIMYVGVQQEKGNRVREEDAFGYACERCLSGSVEEQKEFLDIAKHSYDMQDFAEELVEWFYSGNWYKEVNHEDS